MSNWRLKFVLYKRNLIPYLSIIKYNMRSIIASVAAVALIATANAGIVPGPCPNVTTLPYDTSMATRIGHYLLAVDKTVYSYLGLAEKLAPAGVLPNLTCLNLGNFGYSPDK